MNPIWGAYVGLFLLVGCLVAIGVFASTLFSNQIAAFFVTLGLTLGLWVVSALGRDSTGVVGTVLNAVDISGRYYNNFYIGVIDLTDLVYFISLTALFLFLATQVIASRRWR
jgi:ABC-2 type transport system permease protein